MNSIGKKFNWVARQSVWQTMQAQREKRAEAIAKYMASNQDAVTRFATAQSNHLTGFVSNAQQAAIDRIRSGKVA